jgi:hypothetical protein
MPKSAAFAQKRLWRAAEAEEKPEGPINRRGAKGAEGGLRLGLRL